MASLINVIEELNLSFAYHHFAENNAPNPPFLIYLIPGTNHFKADGKIHHKIAVVHLELYTDKKDLDLETKVETILENYEIIYDKTEVWIESEKLYEVLYTFEMEENKLWETK